MKTEWRRLLEVTGLGPERPRGWVHTCVQCLCPCYGREDGERSGDGGTPVSLCCGGGTKGSNRAGGR